MKDNQRIDQLFRQKLEHFEKQPAASNWSAIEHGIQGNSYGDQIAKGFALLGLLAFLYVGYNTWTDRPINETQIASVEEMIDYELKKEAFELQELHNSNQNAQSNAYGLDETTEASISSEPPLSSNPTLLSKKKASGTNADSQIEPTVIISTTSIQEPTTKSKTTPIITQVSKVTEHNVLTVQTAPIVFNEVAIPAEEQVFTSSPMNSSEAAQTNDLVMTEINAPAWIKLEVEELDNLNTNHDPIAEADLVLRDWIIPKKSFNTGFYTGTVGSGHNSWILNNNAEEVSATENLDYKLDFGVAYGLIAGFDFSKHWGLEAIWIINSKQGQKYENDYMLTGIVSEEEVDLNYMHFPLLMKYKNSQHSSLFNAPRSINVLFGPQYSVVQESTTSFNNGLVVIEELVNTKEFGMSLGLEYSVSIKDNLDVGLGARSSISTDIKMFPRPFSKDLEKSNNLLIGLNAGIRYYPFTR